MITEMMTRRVIIQSPGPNHMPHQQRLFLRRAIARRFPRLVVMATQAIDTINPTPGELKNALLVMVVPANTPFPVDRVLALSAQGCVPVVAQFEAESDEQRSVTLSFEGRSFTHIERRRGAGWEEIPVSPTPTEARWPELYAATA